MIIRHFRVQRLGKTKFDKKIELQCDKCFKNFEMFDASFKLANKRHPNRHLCFKCANAREFKKIIIGEQNKNFKNGLSPEGYKRIYYNGKNQFEHRIIAEQKLNRKLFPLEQVHHVDCDKLNNSLDNLYIAKSRSDHNKCHASMEKIGFNFLNVFIWFNQEKKLYQTGGSEKFNPAKEYGDKVMKEIIILPQIRNEKNEKSKKRYICKYGTLRALHIYLVEYLIGRKLYRDELVHHINGNIEDNNISNLLLATRASHKKIHESLRKCVSELYHKGMVKFSHESGIYCVNKEN
jgi:hypothetical protein